MAQQAAEVSIKAVYMQHGWLFPYIHTLGKLLLLLSGRGGKGGDLSDQVERSLDFKRIQPGVWP
jgi:HEPN domain-containing protein